jgi:ketosteroid isomerase-like protein
MIGVGRLDIFDLISRYCYAVDHDDADGWASLFTMEGVFEVPGIMRLEGRDQLRTMPGIVKQQGDGKWRHQVTNILIDDGAEPDTALVRAYGLVTDWREGGKPVSFTDYKIKLRRLECGWRIQTLVAHMV